MEVGGALFAAFSLPCLVLLLVLGEVGLRVAALARSGCWLGSPARCAFLGYRLARPASSYPYYPATRGYEDEPPLPPESCDLLPLATYRRRPGAAGDPECAFCLSAVRDGAEVRELRCRHAFHRACLDAWLVRPRATCPLCRDRLLPDADPAPSSSAVVSAYHVDGGALWHMT
jgi:E3 ubiquitin-protein ligase RHA2